MAAQLHDLAAVFNHLVAGDAVAVPQPHRPPRRQPLVAGERLEREVVAVDEDLPAEGQHPLPRLADVGREIGAGQLLDLAFRPRCDRHPQRPEHAEDPRRHPVEVVADAELQLAEVNR